MTCPHCRAAAKLAPNPAPNPALTGSAPRYLLTCSGCAETTVGAPSVTAVTIRSQIASAA